VISEPNEAELAWVREYVDATAGFAEQFGVAEGRPGVDELDALWAAWLPNAAPEDANAVVHMIGFSFGQHLVDDFGLRWVVVSDEHGTEMAVHREAGDVLVFPANLVAKRWETRHTGFLRPLYDQVAAL
jgi:Domain of unknown function (DUF3806)